MSCETDIPAKKKSSGVVFFETMVASNDSDPSFYTG